MVYFPENYEFTFRYADNNGRMAYLGDGNSDKTKSALLKFGDNTGHKVKNNPKAPTNMGKVSNGVRIVDADQVPKTENRKMSKDELENANKIFKNFKPTARDSKYDSYDNVDSSELEDINDTFNASSQGHQGDCYYLAEINAIRNCKNGQEILNKNIKKNSDDSVTVTLPGALMLKNKYSGPGCEITGVYTITKSALENAKSSARWDYSSGDLNVIALEIAMETYRKELICTKRNMKLAGGGRTAEGQFIEDESNPLRGGQMYDAAFLLTGQQSEVYEAKYDKTKNLRKYKDGEYGYINIKDLDNNKPTLNTTKALAGTSEISDYSQSEQKLNSMLDKYQGHEKDVAITCSVQVAKDGPDDFTKKGSYHALTVVKITSDTVYVTNPWHPNRVEPVPRRDFIKMCAGLNVQKMNVKEIENNYKRARSGVQAKTDFPIPAKREYNQADIEVIVRKFNSGRTGKGNVKIQDVNMRDIKRFSDIFNSHKANRGVKINKNQVVELLQKMSVNTSSTEGAQSLEHIFSLMSQKSGKSLTEQDMRLIEQFLAKYSIN